jgi:CDP-diacylglycerol--serine O-phosphatidyltransferase
MGDSGKPTKPSPYFLGLPTPGAAGILVSIVVANHAVEGAIGRAEYAGIILAITIGLSFLMVSNVRFRTFKDVKLNLRTAAFVGFAILSSTIISTQMKPAFVLVWLLGFYVLMGLFETLWQLPGRLKARAAAVRDGAGPTDITPE